MSQQRTTPGIDGYLLAYLISVGCVVLFVVAVEVAFEPDNAVYAPAMVVVMSAYAGVLSLPFALVGIPLVHVVASPCRTQTAQVLLTGVVTVVLVSLGSAWILGSLLGGAIVGVPTACATMIGRAAVIPLVTHRRLVELRAQEQLQP
ncbi:hypothetical protein F0U44_20735 [Nocardioides humilatus]|uniref:Uncharacterized protein n=1 Tax=Nocardioides humilatus TaxID=2607660 RepID=A0A5B1L450_9ACTN|nr:hypothetical protein [Nocardioides humilatus]KAA1415422.1 hypothetical protein F0U44_20735 [Nocardioides humilatus]